MSGVSPTSLRFSSAPPPPPVTMPYLAHSARAGSGLAQPRLQAVDHVPVRGPQRERGILCIVKALLQPGLVKLEHSRDKAHGLEHLADGRAELRVVVEPGGVARRQPRLHRVVLA